MSGALDGIVQNCQPHEGEVSYSSTTENGAMTEGADDLQPISDAMPPAAVESIDST